MWNGLRNIGPMISRMKIERLSFRDNGSAFAFTAGRGGVDANDPYSGFNCCGYVGDSPWHVASCREELCRGIGLPAGRLITARQVHGTDVVVVGSPDCVPGEADALVTRLEGAAVGVFTADCVPMLFYDKEAGVVGAAHAGWKGTMNGIAKNVVTAMSGLGASAGGIQVVFGPSICQGCFEVGDEVVEQFGERGLPLGGIVVRNNVTGKAHIDLVAANVYWLRECGVREGNIVLSGLCTRCNPSRFFSARVLGTASGRNLTAVVLRSER